MRPPTYSLSPTAEANGLNPFKRGFESLREYQMSIRDVDYLTDVPCWNCQSVGSVEWRTTFYYCRVCGQSTRMVPVTLKIGENEVKEWRGTGLVR